jgi:hypothetical protein
MNSKTPTPEHRSTFTALTILVALLVSSFLFFRYQDERENREYCEQRLAEMPSTWDVVDTASMMTAFWYTQYPCGIQQFEYPLRALDGPPTPEMCVEARRIVAEREAARWAPRDRYADGVDFYDMISCAATGRYEGDGEKLGVDTVESPLRHGSWVLGGECEQLAFAVQKRAQGPMCKDFVKNDSTIAEKCRLELHAHITELCERDDLDENTLRDCLTMWGRKKPVRVLPKK